MMRNELNPPQSEAVNTLSGPLLVLAGAGTGKTRVVTYRIAKLIKHKTSPNRILAVTFTNKAAKEMLDRAMTLLGKKRKEGPEVSTFHSLCVKILRRHITNLGYPEKFAIYDRRDQESIARGVLRDIKVHSKMLKPGDLVNQIGNWKTHGIRPEQAESVAQTDKEHIAAVAYRRYQTSLKAAGAVDFDDLLLCTEDLFSKFPAARREEAARFDHLLIDEYQDTNASQYRIVKALAAGHRNLCVVGDDDQSIYAFRGAEVEHILRFKKDWPEAKVVRLEDNYRSTAEILEIANRVISYNSNRLSKELRTTLHGDRPKILQYPNETTEAEETVAEIQSLMGKPKTQPRDFAILFRTNEQPRMFETELRKANLPYVLVGGMSFFDRKEVRDMLSYLRVIASPTDEVSLLRIINTPPRGIGQKTVQTLLDHAVSAGKPVWEVLPKAASVAGVTGSAVDAVGRFIDLVQEFQAKIEQSTPVDVFNDLIDKVGYEEEVRRLYPDPDEQQFRWDSIQEVSNALGNYQQKAGKKKATLKGFLDEIMLAGRDFDQDSQQDKRNAITLMTLHSAKGLEFPHVYMVGMEEGILPHHRSVKADGPAIEEERRLCYVGITRAQRRLTFSLALTRMKWGKPRDTDPSRFLFEITGAADKPSAAPSPTKKRRSKRSGAAK